MYIHQTFTTKTEAALGLYLITGRRTHRHPCLGQGRTVLSMGIDPTFNHVGPRVWFGFARRLNGYGLRTWGRTLRAPQWMKRHLIRLDRR